MAVTDAQEIGAELHTARLARDLSLAQVEAAIRIRAKFIEALEEGRFEDLPTEAHARGFLRNYARYLGLNGESFVAWYDGLHGAKGKGKGRRARVNTRADLRANLPVENMSDGDDLVQLAPRRPQSAPEYEVQPTRQPFRLLRLLLALVVILVVLIGAGSIMLLVSGAELPVLFGVSRPTLNVLATVATPTLIPTATVPIRPTLLPNLQATVTPNPTAIAIQLQITARTWLRVTVDGEVRYQGAAAPDTVLQYQGRLVQVRAANGIGVTVLLNNQDLGALGARGEIVDRLYTLEAALAAESAITSAITSGTISGTTVATTDANPAATDLSLPATDANGELLPTFATGDPGEQQNLPTVQPVSANQTSSNVMSSSITASIIAQVNTTTVTLTPSETTTTTPEPPTATPTSTPTSTVTLTPTSLFRLPNVTNTPLGGEIRPKATITG